MRNPFLPGDDYRAELRVEAVSRNSCRLFFTGRYGLGARQEAEESQEISSLLTAAYRMMGDALARRLDG